MKEIVRPLNDKRWNEDMKERVYNILHERDYNGKSKYVAFYYSELKRFSFFDHSGKMLIFFAHAVQVHVVSIDDSKLTGVSLAIKEKCAVEAVVVSVCLDQLFKRGVSPHIGKGNMLESSFVLRLFPLLLILSNFVND